jgi:hypothetical protein
MSSEIQPLLWRQLVGAGDAATETLLIGYAEATLMGVGGQGPTVGQEVHVEVGTSARNLTIHADTLFLQPGAKLAWPGLDVTIVARRIAMASDGANAGPAVLSVSGTEGAQASPPTPPTPPKPAPPPKAGSAWSGYGEPGANATVVPANGVGGASGGSGGKAGRLTLVAYEIDPGCHLLLQANGGNGQPGLPGQNGQDGQDGGAGGDGKLEGNGKFGFHQEAGGTGGHGGNGGHGGGGGAGGNGGAGGTVVVKTCLPTTAMLKLDAVPGTPGANASIGTGGAAGNGGRPGSGPGGGWGAPGQRGGDGTPPSVVPTHGGPGNTAQAAITTNDLLQAMSAEQVVMVLNRLRFNYLTKATLSNLSDADTNVSWPTDINQSVTWLRTMLGAGTPASDDTWGIAQVLLSDLEHKMANRLDYYGNYFNRVPVLNPDISQLAASLDTLAGTETWYLELTAAVANYEANQVTVQDHFLDLKKRTSEDDTTLEDETRALAAAAKDIATASDGVLAAKTALDTRFRDELEKIAMEMHFSLDGLLGSLGSVLMFAGPEFSLATAAGKAYAAGAGLSLASQFDPSTVDAGGQTIPKAYLLQQVKNVEADADALSQAWSTSNGGFLTPNGDNTLLLGKQQEFDKFFTTYMPEDTDIRAAMDAYIAAAQVQNRAVLRYNEEVGKWLAALADKKQAENAEARLGANLEKLDSPGLLQLAQVATHAYARQLEQALESLYVAGRAYSCLALTPCNALNDLASLSGLSELDAQAVKAAFASLQAGLEAFRTGLATNQPSSMSLTISIDEGAGKAVLDAFRKNRQVTLVLDPTPALMAAFKVNGPLDKMRDIRVTDVAAHVTGVPVDVKVLANVSTGGACMVQPSDSSHANVWFDVPEVARVNVFHANPDGTFVDDSRAAMIPNTEMTWGGGDEMRVSVPLLGLYAAWVVSVPDAVPSIDLGKASAISLIFDLTFRAQTATATGGPGAS